MYEIKEINNELYKDCCEYLCILNEILEENGQKINIKLNVVFIINYIGHISLDYDNDMSYKESIYNNYRIENKGYKLKLDLKYYKKKNI